MQATKSYRKITFQLISICVLSAFIIPAASTQAELLDITPTNDFEPAGEQGGPFTPDSKEYLLTNTRQDMLIWGVETTEDRLQFDSDEWVMLDPNESATVTVALTSAGDGMMFRGMCFGGHKTSLGVQVHHLRDGPGGLLSGFECDD